MLRRRPVPRPLRREIALNLIRMHPQWKLRRVNQIARNLAALNKISRKQLKHMLQIGYPGIAETRAGPKPVTMIPEEHQILLEKIWRTVNRKGPSSERKIQMRLWKKWNAEEGWRLAQQLKKTHPNWSAKKISEEVRAILAEDRELEQMYQKMVSEETAEDIQRLIDYLKRSENGKKKRGNNLQQ